MVRLLIRTLTPLMLILACASAAPAAQAAAKKPAAAKNPVSATPESIAAGKALFQKYCRFCHGDDAKGNGPQAPEGTHPPDLTDAVWNHGSTDAEIFANIRDGIGPKFDMKPYGMKLMPQDIWNLVNYLRSIGPQGKRK
jgi:mono/diheme cytochrome c family protein